MPTTLNEWFCLKQDRDSFKLKVKEDSSFVFCHKEEINEQILDSMEMRYAANEPVKMLIYGDWGVGKTHAANHIRWWLKEKSEEYPATTVMIEIGDIEKKSRLDVIVRPFLDEIGLDALVALAREYDKKTGGIEASLQAVGVEQYISTIFSKFLMATPGMTPPQVVQYAYSVLKGKKPPAGGAGMGLGEQLRESGEFYSVLLALGEMNRDVNNNRMIFIADEAAKLEDVEDDDTTRAHWVAANRTIFDDQNDVFGFIYTASAKSSNALPDAIWHAQIQNRIGEQNVIELRNLDAQDVDAYVSSVIGEMINQPCVEALVESGDIVPDEYDAASYPFTKEAKARFIEHWEINSVNAKPRDISDKLNALGFIALKLGTRVITIECLEKANM